MNVKKNIILSAFVLLLIIIPGLFSLKSKTMPFNVYELIDTENMNDISLTIYYLPPHALMFYPVSSVEELIQRHEEKIVISGSDLEQHIDLFRKMGNQVLMPVWKQTSDLDLRVYYTLESNKKGKLLDVYMWGDHNNIFVNGIEVKENNIFYDAIIPFLPEDVAEDFDGL